MLAKQVLLLIDKHTSIIFEKFYVEMEGEKKLCRFASEASKSDKNQCNLWDLQQNLHKFF